MMMALFVSSVLLEDSNTIPPNEILLYVFAAVRGDHAVLLIIQT